MNIKARLIVAVVSLFSLFAVSCSTTEAPEDFNAGNELIYAWNKEGQYGFINVNGEWVIKPKFDGVSMFSEGLAVAISNDKYGYINPDGKWIVNAKYVFARPFSEGLAMVVQDSLCGYINRKGEWVIEPKYKGASSFSCGLASVRLTNGKTGCIDKTGNVVFLINDEKEELLGPFVERRAGAIIDGYFCHIKPNGEPAGGNEFDQLLSDFSEGFATVRTGGKTWYVDTNDLLHFEGFDEATTFADGIAVVADYNISENLNLQFRFIDKNGRTVGEPESNPKWMYKFSCGLAGACYQGELWGYVNTEGQIVIAPKYKKVYNFEPCGLAMVEADTYMAWVNKSGEEVWKIDKPLHQV